jgi:hypothetical protein
MGPGQAGRLGVVIAFTKPVDTKTIDAAHIFQILIDHDRELNTMGLHCRCAIDGETVPVRNLQMNGGVIVAADLSPNQMEAAVAFLIPREPPPPLLRILETHGEFWVLLRCDFVLDIDKRAVDGEHVRGKLPSGDRPAPPQPGHTHGIQGGLFESWFLVGQG